MIGKIPGVSPKPTTSAKTDQLARTVRSLRRKCAEAGRANEVQAVLFATVSHEVREPMNGVLGMTRLLADTPLTEEQRGYLAAVEDSAEALVTVINDMLDLSKIEAGRLRLDAIDFDPRGLLERVAAPLRARAEAKGVAFRVEVARCVPASVRGDPGRLRQILVNLLGNAVKFTERGEVRLAVRRGRRRDGRLGLSFVVSDTGIGIPEPVRKRLFSPYTQADPNVARAYGGTGLGLAVCRRLVGLMGGAIVVGDAPGGGAAFRFNVALDPAAATAASRTSRTTSPRGLRLLIVDPDDTTREATRARAGAWGVIVEAARDARGAMRLLEAASAAGRPFDVALIDRSLPDGDGEAFGRRVRRRRDLADTRLVLLAAAGLRGDAARVRAIGFAAYLTRPLETTTLLALLTQLGGGRTAGAEDDELITRHSITEGRARALSILIADDNPVNRRLAQIMLDRAGHRTEVVNDGLGAVEAVRDGAYDLVLMDVRMPGLSGLDATRRIRALAGARAGVPIIAVTANAMKGDDALCRDAGMNDYLTKPIDRAALLGKIAAWAEAPAAAH